MTTLTTTIVEVEKVQGTVERITFHSEESGFCVVRAKVKGQRDLVTVIGNAASIAAGEFIQCQGEWINDKKHGRQFKASELKVIPPTTQYGMEKYLASGMVKGIGPHFAQKLVQAFGADVFDVIEKTPQRLKKLGGIGEKRLALIMASWAEQKAIRNIMVFLQEHGVGTARAVRIFKVYGDKAIEIVRANPYRLALDIHGIGFIIADTFAQKLGIARDSVMRAQAGIHHALQAFCEQGHCAVEYDQLVAASMELLDIPQATIALAIEKEIAAEHLVSDLIDEKPCIYPWSFYQAETIAAQHIQRLNKGKPPWGDIDCAKAIPWVEKKTGLQLSESQQQALTTVLQHKLSIITGGPGVGKTTLVNSLLKIIQAKKLSIGLCAPTGRAAKRLSETTGLTAKTIHRLLEYDPISRSFKRYHENPLAFDVIVIDESSMLDIVLTHHLLRAIPKRTAVIFVGDIDQLPSVGSGAVLSDLIRSGALATVRLTEIFRQAANSKIITNAHRINQGLLPLADNTLDSDFYILTTDAIEVIHDKLIQLVKQRIPDHLGCNPITDIQVLTPMHRGGLGSYSLNIDLQQALNGQAEPKITRFGWTFAPGDKVIQTVNNYDKDVYNGDIGFIHSIDEEKSVVHIQFDNHCIEYDINELDEVSLAYAISIHKSQGSEFPVVIIPLVTQHYRLLARNLLYTAVTRGKKLVILIGQKKAISLAIHNNRAAQRLTKLAQRLKITA